MQFLKKHGYKIIVIPIICIICLAAAILPSLLRADSFVWRMYVNNTDHCAGGHTDHLVISNSYSGSTIEFFGHYSQAFFDYALTTPTAAGVIENEFFNFTLTEGKTDWHTLQYSGFCFNVNSSGQGYFIGYGTSNVGLFYFNNGTLGSCISTCGKAASTVHSVSIQASQDHLVYIDNNQILFDMPLAPTGGVDFGPGVKWGGHGCNSESYIKFENVVCGVNVYPPVADFNYNVSVADIRTRVYVTYTAQDKNTPASPLTYLWSVAKINEDGTRTVLCTDSPTPFTMYNEYGVGKYETTLRVKNGYYFFSTPVTKVVEITTMPTIAIVPEKNQYNSGDNVKFKCDKWYNCASTAGDIVIENVISKNLYSPTVGLVGSSAITSTSGDLTVNVLFEYTDGTISAKTIAVPAAGASINDSANSEKQVSKITVTYKSIPRLAELSSGNYLTYEYVTKNPLSNYYAGGVSPRRYEATNTVTCKIDLGSKVVTASDSATTNFVERFASFSLSGTVDNRDAITEPPICNTEFLLTGLSYGGENLSNYMVVTDGESKSIQLPYGEYTLNEDSGFALGYDLIDPISLVIDERGITIDNKTTIPNNGKVPFMKPLQVATINVSRVYESAADIKLRSDTDFKVMLKGTPVVNEIKASFELISPSDDETYYYNLNTSELILPIGTYSIDETQRYRLTALQDIHVGDELLWDSTLSARKNAEPGRVTFAATKNQTSSVVLKYISDEY